MLGPHFYYDVIRIARKGWPTLLRVVFLVVLLISLGLVYQSSDALIRPRDFAVRAQQYVHFLITVQYILILLLLPVYVANAIVEEKENQTLEALSMTHLTDQEMVLGKLGARLAHVALLLLAGLPLLTLMHLWGNVDIAFLLYHEANTFLLLAAGGSACIFISTTADSVFQAMSRSYPWMLLLGLVGIVVGFLLPYISGGMIRAFTGGELEPVYFPALFFLTGGYSGLAYLLIDSSVRQMVEVRRRAARKVARPQGTFVLSDQSASPPKMRKGKAESRIHPLALPICEPAIFWKECMKDGSVWSLKYRWCLTTAAIIFGLGIFYRILPGPYLTPIKYLTGSLGFTAYVIAGAAYLLMVGLQMTMSIAGEREHDTLIFLLMIPDDRRHILFMKWLGPLWRNWPILAIAYLGSLVAWAGGVISLPTLLFHWVFPIPFLLMLTGVGLWLSVRSRRVLYANLIAVGCLLGLVIVHVAASPYLTPVLQIYINLLGDVRWNTVDLAQNRPTVQLSDYSFQIATIEQSLFFAIGLVALILAYRNFMRNDFASKQ